MSDRSYFLLPKNAALISKVCCHEARCESAQLQSLAATTLKQHGLSEALAPQLLAFEHKLAKLMLSQTALRDPVATYHVFTKPQVTQVPSNSPLFSAVV